MSDVLLQAPPQDAASVQVLFFGRVGGRRGPQEVAFFSMFSGG
jgi:hypothetical protein